MQRIYSVFVSSTFEDLLNERRVIADVLLNCSCFPRGMELFTANARKPWDVISKEIEDCDFYLLLIGGRYGSYCEDEDVRDRKISFTQREFEYADYLGKPIIIFILKNWRELPQDKKHIDWERGNDRADHVKQDKLDKFITLARDNTRRSSAQWSNSNELKYEVQRAVMNQINVMKETDGWIRANKYIPKDNSKQKQSASAMNKNDEDLTVEESQTVSLFIEKFLSFSDDSLRIKHMELCNYVTHINVIKDEEFVFSLFSEMDINKHTPEYISGIIDFICYRSYDYSFDERVRYYYKQQNYSSIIDLLNIGASLENHLFESTTNLIKHFSMSRSAAIPDTIINYLRQYSTNEVVKRGCINVMEDYGIGQNHTWLINELCILLKSNGSNNDILPLTTEEAISLFVTILDDDDFENFYNVFVEISNKKMMVEGFIDKKMYDEEFGFLCFRKPKIQRMFFDFRNSVYDFDDDELAANMFSYCLFFRIDIYSIDEILEDAISLNEDAFYLFIQNFDDFLWEYRDDYVINLMSNIDEKIVLETIKKRNHPREKKLIQIINDKYNWLKEMTNNESASRVL